MATKFRRCCGAKWTQAFGRPRAERCGAIDRRARTRTDGVRLRHLWDLHRHIRQRPTARTFEAELDSVDGRNIPVGKDFDSTTGKLKNPKLLLLDEAGGRRHLPSGCATAKFKVDDLEDKPYTTQALPAVHHEHAATRSEPQAGFHRAAHDASGAKLVRKWSHHLHAYRLDQLGAGRVEAARELVAVEYGQRYSARPAAHLRNESQERAGSSRSDSPGGSSV